MRSDKPPKLKPLRGMALTKPIVLFVEIYAIGFECGMIVGLERLLGLKPNLRKSALPPSRPKLLPI